MAPHRNHVESRSSRAPARQYVSESHDHKPESPSARLEQQIARLVIQIARLPERGERRAVLTRELTRLRLKQMQRETGFRPRKWRPA